MNQHNSRELFYLAFLPVQDFLVALFARFFNFLLSEIFQDAKLDRTRLFWYVEGEKEVFAESFRIFAAALF